MIKSLALAATLGLATTGLATSAQALDLSSMSEAERAAFGEEVRAYLLANPQVIMEAVAELEKRNAEAQAAGDKDLVATNAEALFDDPHSWVGGNPEGDVTVVEFMDYRCGYCRKSFPEVKEMLAQDGDIRLIIKEFPILGDASTLASRFAIATLRTAGDAGYENVHEAMMTFQGDFTEATLRRIAEGFDLDADAIIAEMDSDEISKIIAENHALAQRMRISGTPTFVMGDEMVRGYIPLDTMQQIVTQEREGS